MSAQREKLQWSESAFRDLCHGLAGEKEPGGADGKKPAGGKRDEEIFRPIIESLAEGLVLTDRESRILYVNRLLAGMTGYSPEELLGKISYQVFSAPDDWPVMQRRLQDRLAGKSESYEIQMTSRDGGLHWVAVKASPYRNASGEILGTIGAVSCLERQKILERENEYFQAEFRESFGDIIGRSSALEKVLAQMATVAPTEANVLVFGESGSGKELVARAIHDLSSRRNRALVRVNCASIPKELFESEFFGHARGAFTGAVRDRAGRFELADRGTLFLDEVGEIPLDLQGKLLRVLQEGQFERLGEDRTRTVRVRLIAATNRDLLAEARAGHFRLDLYYRLSVFPIELPPLRDRTEDIALLVEHFLAQSARRLGIPTPRPTRAQLADLERYDWPGNIRELQNVIERAVILARGGPVRFGLPGTAPTASSDSPSGSLPEPNDHGDLSFDELRVRERQIVESALRRTQGKVYGNQGAAKLLGVKPTTLISKIKRLKISPRRI